MRAAIEVIEGAGAIRVPRVRFAPVKLCSDLLALGSDAYVLTEDGLVVLNPAGRGKPPIVTLGPRIYTLIDDLKARVPAGAPSPKACEAFKVVGDVRFGSGIVVRDQLSVANQTTREATIPHEIIFEGGLSLRGLLRKFVRRVLGDG